MIQTLVVRNCPQLVPCGIDVNVNNHLIVLDPANKALEIVVVADDLKTGIALQTIGLGPQCSPIDCCYVNHDPIAVSDMVGKEVMLVSVKIGGVKFMVEGRDFSPAGLCAVNELVLLSDKELLCVCAFELDEHRVEPFIGTKGVSGFEDGPLSQTILTSLVGLGKTMHNCIHC